MKNTKKVLSVILSVVMVLSALTIVAFAHTYTGTEVDGVTNVKYEVTQVSSITENKAGGYTYNAVDNDIYAVSVYVKAAAGYGLNIIQVPIQYDKDKFEPFMQFDTDEDEMQFGYEDYYSDYGNAQTQFYTHPARFDDDGMYDETGTPTTKKKAKCFGDAHPDLTTHTTFKEQFMDPSNPKYASWVNGLAANIGVMFISLTGPNKLAKAPYINAEYGILKCDDYVLLDTVYFHRVDGVTEADCYGAEFGIADASNFGTQLTAYTATYAGYSSADVLISPVPEINYANAAVEAAVKPLVALTATNGAKQQGLAFKLATAAVTEHTNNATPYTEASIASVDYRFVAQFSTSAFTLEYDTDGKITNTNLDEVGFVLTRTDSGVTAADIAGYSAAQVSALTKDSGDVRKCWTQNISSGMAGDAAFAFTCRIVGIGAADSSQPLVGTFSADNVSPGYLAVPYVLTNDGTIYFGQAMTVLKADILSRYTNNVNTFLTKANAA